MRKTFLLLAAMCCIVINSWSADDVINYIAPKQLELDATKFTPNFTDHTYDASTQTGTLTFPSSVTAILFEAFRFAFVTSITIPNSVVSIEENAFFNSKLKTVYIGSGVSNIGEDAFNACYNLQSIEVDATNTKYSSKDGVLMNKAQNELITYPLGNSRTCYTIPSSVTKVGKRAIASSNLHTIILPSSLTTLGDFALNSPKLEMIICKATTPPTCKTNDFESVDESIPVFVPVGTISKYQGAEGWNHFTNYDEYVEYDLKVMDERVSTVNRTDILGDGGSMKYDHGTKTLTLNNVDLTAECTDIILTLQAMTIECRGENKLTNTFTTYGRCVNVGSGNLTITGDGSLTMVTSGLQALHAYHDLFIKDGCTVTAQSTNNSSMKFQTTAMTINNATLIAKGNGTDATITGCSSLTEIGTTIASEHTFDSGIFKDKEDNEAKDDILIGQIYPVEVKDQKIHAFNCKDVFEDGTVAYDPKSKILTLNDANIEGDYDNVVNLSTDVTVQCIGDNRLVSKKDYSDGIWVNGGDLTITGPGTLYCEGTYYGGIHSLNNITIKDQCKLTCSSTIGNAIFMDYKELTIDNASLLAKGNETESTIFGCGKLEMTGVEILSGQTYNESLSRFETENSDVAKDDIEIGVKVSYYNVYVEGKRVTSLNNKNILGDGTMSYNNKEKTLTIKNANITYDGDYLIRAKQELTIACEGDNVLHNTSGVVIYNEKDKTTITGNGSLSVESDGDNAISLSDQALEVANTHLLAKGNGKSATIIGCSSLDLYKVEILSGQTYDTKSHKFLNADSNESKEDIEVGVNTGIEEVQNAQCTMHDVRKVLRDGQLLILREGKTYNAQGARL